MVATVQGVLSPCDHIYNCEPETERLDMCIPRFYILNQQMLTKYGKDPSVTNIVDMMDWVIMPVFNVDGYEYTHTKVGLVFIFGTDLLFVPATVQY